MSYSTRGGCEGLAIRGLYFLLGHSNAAAADSSVSRAPEPNSLSAVAAHSSAPWESVLKCDNGASFGKSFKEQIEEYEPKITVM
eukprot:COSAG06_NODE_57958_length_278_cov_1.256983_1_plen_83_part_10